MVSASKKMSEWEGLETSEKENKQNERARERSSTSSERADEKVQNEQIREDVSTISFRLR